MLLRCLTKNRGHVQRSPRRTSFSQGTFGDCHLYLNHLEQAREQLSREPKMLPRMVINPDVNDLFAFQYDDFSLVGYDPHPAIKAPVAV